MDIWSQATYLGIIAPNVIFNIMFYSYQCFPNDPISRNQLRQIHLLKASLTVLLDFWCPSVFTPSLHRLTCCMTVNVATCWQLARLFMSLKRPLLADTTGDFIIWNINVYCLIQSIPNDQSKCCAVVLGLNCLNSHHLWWIVTSIFFLKKKKDGLAVMSLVPLGPVCV